MGNTRLFPPQPFILLITISLLLLLQGCSPFQDSETEEEVKELSTLTIVYQEDSLLYLPLYAAIKQGFFEQEKLTIELIKTTGQEAVTGLDSGQKYDLMLGGPEIGFYRYQQEEQEMIVFIGQIASKNGYFLLTRMKEKPFSWEQVKGKVIIGLNSGEAAQVSLENVLRKQHLRPFLDVHMVNNLPAALRSGIFSSGTGQFILCAEPLATILEKEELGLVVASLHDVLGINTPTVLMANKTCYQEKGELFQRLNKALRHGLTWVEEKSPEEIALVAKDYFPKQDERILLRGICRYKNMGCWPGTTELTEKELQQFQQLLLDAQELNAPLPLYEFIK